MAFFSEPNKELVETGLKSTAVFYCIKKNLAL